MPIWTKSLDNPIQITFVLFDQFSNNALGNCLEPFRACNSYAQTPVFEWRFLTPDGNSVQSSSGLPILPEGAISDIKRCDYLFLNSSYDYALNDTSRTRTALRQAAKLSKTVVGLDTGAWLMASAGLLDNKQATIHWDILDSFSETFPDIETTRARVIHDGNRITSAGAMASFDLSLSIITHHLGQSKAIDIEAFFMKHEAPHQHKVPNTRDALINAALDVIHNNLEAPLSRTALASKLSCQPKTLDRRSIATLGAPISQVYRHVRLTAVHHMMTNTNLSVLEVAIRTGFQNPSAMARAFKARFGIPPSASRKKP